MVGYDAPKEVHELEKLITSFSYKQGKSTSQIIDDFLRFVIHGYSPFEGPLENWKYKKEDIPVFLQMYSTWAEIMKRMIAKKGWYDAFGDLYMANAGISTQQNNGQFFTPDIICNSMSRFISDSSTKEQVGLKVSDPACGSGRCLLSFHSEYPGNYLFGEDINYTCCMMSVCNFLIHGCVGEIVCHNSLDPESFQDGWRVNEFLTRRGLPTIRRIKKEESFTWRVWQNRKQEVQQMETPIVAEEVIFTVSNQGVKKVKEDKPGKVENIQLTLFDF